jgi:exodeoxyribonuclease V gamma subunit
MLKVVYSNDMLQLAARLAEQQKSAPLPPLESEIIIVQSNELSRWLSLYIAQHHGIASHIDFPYPSAYIWALFRRVLPEIPHESAFSKVAMTWRIFDLLPVCSQQPGFEVVAGYLGEEDDVVKRYGLAHRIADSFDQYLMYRPDWIKDWEKADASLPHWQAKLWKHLTKKEPKPALHRANLLDQLTHYLWQSEKRPEGLPRRLAIFGISALPPVYLELYVLMAKFCDITLYFLSPSEGYWGDLQDSKRKSQQVLKTGEEAYFLDTGHPLLASLGKQGQEFFEQIQGCEHESESIFSSPEKKHLLGYIQRDIYDLYDPSLSGQKRLIYEADNSIQIHDCHSALREVEILHDQLLALFDRHSGLAPADVVVMTPDIDVYAGSIDAVFGCASQGQYIPYGISGASGQQQSPLLSAFNQLLDLPASRFEVDSIISLLECEAIQNRFSFDQTALDLVRKWCRETKIHWAYSSEDKLAMGLPTSEINSWRAGLDRLLLGYAMPLSNDKGQWTLFDDKLAFDGVSGDRANTMAQLCAFVDCLDRFRKSLNKPRTASQWQQHLLLLVEAFFLEDHEQAETLKISNSLDSFVESTELANFGKKMSIDLVCEWLKEHLNKNQNEPRFMGQGVTFCGMVPMRSIPFSVVCLIGMNGDSYPRRQPKQGFDLLSADFRRGDRSRRDDDRYLFLEAILSAGEHLYISYVGRSIVDNSEIPPSVLVSDMHDILLQGFSTNSENDIWQQILTEHPLQAFSQRYFEQTSEPLINLFSYQVAYCPPDKAEKTNATAWFEQSLQAPDISWRQISLNELNQFYRHPGRYLLQQRLRLRLEFDDELLDPREPFSLGSLEAWQLRQQLLSQHLKGDSLVDALPMIKATGSLPHGEIGQQLFYEEANKVNKFAVRLADYPEQFIDPISFELSLSEFSLVGQLDDCSAKGLFNYRLSKAKGGDLLSIWCSHLVLNCLRPQGVLCESRWITEDIDIKLKVVADPESLLLELLEVYWQGCQQAIPLFSKTSFAYAKAFLKNGKGDPDNPMMASWEGNKHTTGEMDDNYYQQLYKAAPLNDEFKKLAIAIYKPIYDHLEDPDKW